VLRSRRYLDALVWATLQNAGAVVGFMYTIEFYKTNRWLPAALAMVACAIISVVVVAA
jgi:hypothetical protein